MSAEIAKLSTFAFRVSPFSHRKLSVGAYLSAILKCRLLRAVAKRQSNHKQLQRTLLCVLALSLHVVPTAMRRITRTQLYAPSLQSLELELALNLQRQEHLRKQCHLLGYKRYGDMNLTQMQRDNLLVNRRNRLLYCNLPMVSYMTSSSMQVIT